jgi:hypothetical protein
MNNSKLKGIAKKSYSSKDKSKLVEEIRSGMENMIALAKEKL